MELERLAREGGKELRGRGERELIVELRLNYILFKYTNKHWLEDEGTMVTRVIDFKDRDEGDGFCFKMQVAGIMIITMI